MTTHPRPAVAIALLGAIASLCACEEDRPPAPLADAGPRDAVVSDRMQAEDSTVDLDARVGDERAAEESGTSDSAIADAGPESDGSHAADGMVVRPDGAFGELDSGPCPVPPAGCSYDTSRPGCALRCPCGSTSCDETQWCMRTTPGACSGEGTCVPRPASCPSGEYEPVCGCDGATYNSACDANRLGVAVAREGECDSADCRMRPCPPGWACRRCGERHACLRPGDMC